MELKCAEGRFEQCMQGPAEIARSWMVLKAYGKRLLYKLSHRPLDALRPWNGGTMTPYRSLAAVVSVY
jgi:hypothetical protein